MSHPDDERGDDERDRPCGRHVPGERGADEVEVPGDDDVGQVRTRKQQRAGVADEQAPVEERALPRVRASAMCTSTGVTKRGGGIEVQERRDRADQHRRCRRTESPRPTGQPGEPAAGCLEQAGARRDRPRPEGGRRRERKPANPALRPTSGTSRIRGSPRQSGERTDSDRHRTARTRRAAGVTSPCRPTPGDEGSRRRSWSGRRVRGARWCRRRTS